MLLDRQRGSGSKSRRSEALFCPACDSSGARRYLVPGPTSGTTAVGYRSGSGLLC